MASASSKPPKRKAFLLRLSGELYRELQEWAEQEMRSVNGQIEYLLHQAALRRRGRPRDGETGRRRGEPR